MGLLSSLRHLQCLNADSGRWQDLCTIWKSCGKFEYLNLESASAEVTSMGVCLGGVTSCGPCGCSCRTPVVPTALTDCRKQRKGSCNTELRFAGWLVMFSGHRVGSSVAFKGIGKAPVNFFFFLYYGTPPPTSRINVNFTWKILKL